MSTTPPLMKAIIVSSALGVLEVSLDELVALARSHGWLFRGPFTPRFRVRPELYGQPVFSGLRGPMYQGPGVIRYECPVVHAECSR